MRVKFPCFKVHKKPGFRFRKRYRLLSHLLPTIPILKQSKQTKEEEPRQQRFLSGLRSGSRSASYKTL